MSGLRIVVAPDSFKGSATAQDAARWIAEGWSAERAADLIQEVPMADGGDGTAAVLAASDPRAERRVAVVTGPDGRLREASWTLLPDGTAIVELAAASGLALLPVTAPLTASTTGFGELIAAALDAGARRLLLAIGGSASTDGGTGMLRALGARFTDAEGGALLAGGGALGRLAAVDLTALRPLPEGGVDVLVDVRNPLLGPEGAAAVYGSQKGATPADAAVLEAGLERLAALLPVDAEVAGAGAAGGTGFGLLAWGARLAPGAPAVADAVGLVHAVAGADVVITGEGRWDGQSSGGGKAPATVLAIAAAAGVRALLVAGAIEGSTSGFADAVSLTALVGREAALAAPAAALRTAGATLARRHALP